MAVSAESLQSFKQKEPSDSDGRKDREEERQELQTSTAHSKGVAKSRAQRAQPRGEMPTALSRMPVVQARSSLVHLLGTCFSERLHKFEASLRVTETAVHVKCVSTNHLTVP